MDIKDNMTPLKTKIETRNLEIFDNTNEVAVTINESKARLIYNKYIKSTGGETVLSFFGNFLSCLITLLTATFNDIFEIEGSASTLTAIFVLLTIFFGLLTIIWFIKWINSLSTLNESAFIRELKGDTSSFTSHK